MSPREPQSILNERSKGDLHQMPLADMKVTPLSFTPTEWLAESVVAPVCKVPSFELLVFSRWSDSSLHKPTASPVVDYDAGDV